MNSSTLQKVYEVPQWLQAKFGNEHIVFRYLLEGNIRAVSVAEYLHKANAVSLKLLESGVQEQDRVVTIIDNSPFWNYLDVGIMAVSAIHVPLSILQPDEQLAFILKSVSPSVIIVSNAAWKHKIEGLLNSINKEANVYTVPSFMNDLTTPTLTEIESLETRKNKNTADTIAAIHYTSGSTNQPKGVVLTHKNLLASALRFSATNIFDDCTDALSLLQLCFSAERKLNYSYQLRGIAVNYPGSSQTLADAIRLYKPQVAAVVPYLLQQLNKEITTLGSLKKIVCGGAALPKIVAEELQTKGIETYQVYGLTETASLLSYNTPDSNNFSSVGKIDSTIQFTIAQTAELLIQGDTVSKGYWQADGTVETLFDENGWFHTGDIVEMDGEGFLYLIGRIKNQFKNSRGSFVYPEPIEQQLMNSGLFDSVLIFGENEEALCALLILKGEAYFKDIAMKEIEKYNTAQSEFLKIKKVFLPPNNFDTNQYRTGLMKLNRTKLIEQINPHSFITIVEE